MAENRAVLSPDGGQSPTTATHITLPAPAASPTLPVHEELKIPSASSSFRAPIFFQSLRAIASACRLVREGLQRLAAARLVRAHH